MGLYINPPTMTKEEFLAAHAERVTEQRIQKFLFDPDKMALPLCLVDNGNFTALAVGFDKQETLRWHDKRDFRPKKFYIICKNVLAQQELSGITKDEYESYIVKGGRT